MNFQTKIAESRSEAVASLAAFLQKLAMGVPPPLPAAAKGMLGAAKSVAKPGAAALVAGAGTGFKSAPALNPFKTAADLTPEARAKLPAKDFAVKAKKSNTGHEAYPIPDRQHARSALGFAKMHGDEADLAAVRKKIEAKYPDMLKAGSTGDIVKVAGGLLARLAGGGPTAHKAELAGLGVLAAPVGYELQKNIREGHTGDAISNTAELGGLGILAAPAAAALRHGVH